MSLTELLDATTQMYRKTDAVYTDGNGATHVWVDTPHAGEVTDDERHLLVDVHFFIVSVDKEAAEEHRDELIALLDDWPPDPGYVPENRLPGGPSYIELGAQAGTLMGQQDALRMMALGEVLGLWKLITPKRLFPDMPDPQADELAGKGYVMITGYRPSETK